MTLRKLALLYGKLISRRPATMLIVLLTLAAASLYGASQLSINTNQLDLISQDLWPLKGPTLRPQSFTDEFPLAIRYPVLRTTPGVPLQSRH